MASGLAEGDEPGSLRAVHLTRERRLQHLQQPLTALYAKLVLWGGGGGAAHDTPNHTTPLLILSPYMHHHVQIISANT